IRAYIVPHIGNVPLAKLGTTHVRTMLAALEAAGRSPRTAQYARSVLRRALRHAERDALVARNVAALVDGPRSSATKLDDTLTASEARSVVTAAAGHRLEALAVLVLELGLRKGEALGLLWSDVDLDVEELTVRGTLKRGPQGLYVDTTKTALAERTIPLPVGTADALRVHRTRQAEERLAAGPLWVDSDYVFSSEVGTPIDPRNALRWWKGLTRRAGVGERRFHSSRHTAATLMLDDGVPLEVVSAILGHASLSITADVYARVSKDAKRRALTGLKARLGSQ
ncbi:MAG: tyrosine-type recombinase/integrase, partial [Acidimicrobiales bacterium]